MGGGSTLTVTPVVELTGLAEGRSFTAVSPAGLPFALDAASLRPTGGGTDLAPIAKTDVTVEEIVPRTIPVLDFQVPIGVARLVAAGIFVVALLVLGAGAWIGRTGRGDAADQFIVRHADRILPVSAFDPGPTVFDVADAESLHRMAERFDTVVLHHATEDEDVFVVRDADATYRFVVPGAEGRRRGKPPVPASAHAPVPEPAGVPLAGAERRPAPLDSTYPAADRAPGARPALEPRRLTRLGRRQRRGGGAAAGRNGVLSGCGMLRRCEDSRTPSTRRPVASCRSTRSSVATPPPMSFSAGDPVNCSDTSDCG